MGNTNMSDVSKRLSREFERHVGRNTIFKKLREAGYLNRQNVPYAQYHKYFISQQVIRESGFSTRITLVKPNGIELIRKVMK